MSKYGAFKMKAASKTSLLKNMQKSKLTVREFLRNNVMTITFKKIDGSERVIVCTLNPSLLPPRNLDAKTRKQNPDIIAVYDLEEEDWRSFRFDNLLDVSFSIQENREYGLVK